MIEGAGSCTFPAPLIVCSIEFQEGIYCGSKTNDFYVRAVLAF